MNTAYWTCGWISWWSSNYYYYDEMGRVDDFYSIFMSIRRMNAKRSSREKIVRSLIRIFSLSYWRFLIWIYNILYFFRWAKKYYHQQLKKFKNTFFFMIINNPNKICIFFKMYSHSIFSIMYHIETCIKLKVHRFFFLLFKNSK